MGNSTNKLSWAWPLISYDWLPEILKSFKELLEPTWEGLNRQLSLHAANHAFSNQIFYQLKELLTQTMLVESHGRYIKPTIRTTEAEVRNHLDKVVKKNYSYSTYYDWISARKEELLFKKIKKRPPKMLPEISNYSIFKQWCGLYQYLGYGYLIDNYRFIPNAAIADHLVKNISFVEITMKAVGDPRHLTGRNCLHIESDFLSWSRGEDNLAITSDSDIIPSIPLKTIIKERECQITQKDSWRKALDAGRKKWDLMINQLLMEKLPFHLSDLIYTWKTTLDYFLFGKHVLTNNVIDNNLIFEIQHKWETTKHFSISTSFWKTLPKLYKDITRLYWGISYYRNSLKRPISQFKFDETIFDIDVDSLKDIHIRCFRSKRTIQAIIRHFSTLYKSLKRLYDRDIHLHYRNKCNDISFDLNDYLPHNPIDKSDILKQLDSFITLDLESKKILMNSKKSSINYDCPKSELLQICFWINQYDYLSRRKEIPIINHIKKQCKKIKNEHLKEIEYFDHNSDRWKELCLALRKEIVQK